MKAMSLASSQSYFLNLKLGEHLVEFCKGNLKLKEEVTKFKIDLEAAEERKREA